MLKESLRPTARRRRGSQRRSCWVAGPSQALTFFGRRGQLRGPAGTLALGQARQALALPTAQPPADAVVAPGNPGGHLCNRGPPVVAQHGLRPAAQPRVRTAGGSGFKGRTFGRKERERSQIHSLK